MASVLPKYAYFQGKIVPFEEAKVSVMNHTLNYGTGAFSGIRAYWNADEEQLYIFRPIDHLKRLRNSVKLLSFDLECDPEHLLKMLIEMLRLEGWQTNTYIRPLAYITSNKIGVKLNDLEYDITMFSLPFGSYVKNEEKSDVTFSSWRRVDDNAIPARGKITGSYANSAFIKTDALRNGFDEALVLNQDGHISEGSAENFFMIRDGIVYTPPITDNVLEGITRRTVMHLMREELGLTVVERSIDRTEVYIADEAFFCGTGVQIATITHIDHRPIGDGVMGPAVRKLRDLYFSVVEGRVPKYRAWNYPVYEK